MIELTRLNTYKDGGSVTYIGSDGKLYWQDLSISSRGTDAYGKLFEGKVIHDRSVLAKGNYKTVVHLCNKCRNQEKTFNQ